MSKERRSRKAYRIVGIRRDDSREVLRTGLAREQATALFATLMNSEEFIGFSVERDRATTNAARDRIAFDDSTVHSKNVEGHLAVV